MDKLNPLDNVICEAINEADGRSLAWGEWVMGVVRTREAGLPAQHPVEIGSGAHRGIQRLTFPQLVGSTADWVAPSADGFKDCDGRKVVLFDDDHNGTNKATPEWYWQNVCRGGSPLSFEGGGRPTCTTPPSTGACGSASTP